jgi:anti-sigma regulatory factor (Ser/Thr protein kinase)
VLDVVYATVIPTHRDRTAALTADLRRLGDLPAVNEPTADPDGRPARFFATGSGGPRNHRGVSAMAASQASDCPAAVVRIRRDRAGPKRQQRSRIRETPCINRAIPVIARSGGFDLNLLDAARVHVPVAGMRWRSCFGQPGKGHRDEMSVAMGQRHGCERERGEEREHELSAALFGLEASAEALSRHRQDLTDRQFDQLTQGILEEVRRLRALLAGQIGAPTHFDLAEAIAPVIACARASGLDVTSSVPPGIEVEGRRDSTAQVVLALLDNARRHAGASPVEVRATVLCGAVALYVEDRGTGISGVSSARLFDRGVRGADSTGSGLGLFIARRLMAEQEGTIAVRPRAGGGTSFVLRFRRAPSTESPAPRRADVLCLTRR